MLLYAGIDEAGYGPLLGPLCVAMTIWEVPEAGEPPDLWKLLQKAACRKPRDRRGRVAFEDSKRLKLANDGATHPLIHLERGVLAALGTIRDRGSGVGLGTPATDDDLFARLGAAPPSTCHWYGASRALPVANDAALLRIASSMLRRAMDTAGVSLRAIACRAIDAEELNTRAALLRSKAAVNGAAALLLVDQALRLHAEAPIRIALDRHGGRIHYRQELSDSFPGTTIRIEREDDAASHYTFTWRDRSVHVSWEVGAESMHLPVALASMTAKFVRELWMARFNDFFSRRFPDLKATAGYTEDGRRWLAQVAESLVSLGIEERRLVRQV